MKGFVSVIIPVYNEEKYIGQCLKSLQNQTYRPLEIIVVDDASTDRSNVKCQMSNVKNLKIFVQKHQGPAKARNLGVSHAGGDILVFVDSDMTFTADFIERLTAPIRERKAKGTFSKDEFVANWENVWARCWNFNQGLKDKRRLAKDYPNKAPVFRAILKSEFERVDGYDDIGYTDDWTLSRKLGYSAGLARNAVNYHHNPDSLGDVFIQARWIGKNEFIGGRFKSLLLYSLFMSVVVGLINIGRYKEPRFLIFKIVYDLGVFISVIESFLNRERLQLQK